MTELEKLAEEWVHGPDAEIMDTWQAHKKSFEDGFRKAREMASSCLRVDGIRLEKSGLVATEKHQRLLSVEIEQLGEEEI